MIMLIFSASCPVREKPSSPVSHCHTNHGLLLELGSYTIKLKGEYILSSPMLPQLGTAALAGVVAMLLLRRQKAGAFCPLHSQSQLLPLHSTHFPRDFTS